ncbi:SMP-30/gluconolactonase/LRE family protein [Halorubrum sp. DTA46]|uniref:SMP-30/gluconolactonase/LRE family protein n=1 Tax=Halorubrum sp. DTA46 TaxID=3402162 RepID=UPI003AAD8870
MVRTDRVADETAHTGEGPLWHPAERLLYWVDIPAGRLYQYDPESGSNEIAYETGGDPLGGYTVEADGALLLFTHGAIERWVPGTSEAKQVASVDADTRFNDVIADPEGRVFAGTMPGDERLGDLYRIDADGSVRVVETGLDIPNGMGFSGDATTFYLTESEARRIYAYDYDYATGELTNRRTFVETPPGDGVPDGMTVDADDHVWSARWDGGRAVRYDPTGQSVAEISLPARKVASLTFAGPSRDVMYLTTALSDSNRSIEGDGAGALFRATGLATGGRSEFRSRIAVE